MTENFFTGADHNSIYLFNLRQRLKKVKLSLCLIKHHAMKTDGGSEGMAPPFLTLAQDGAEHIFTTREKYYSYNVTPCTQIFMTSWVWYKRQINEQ
jgi:hypothetical protein